MKMIVTGASGFVGRELVPLLAGAGAELLLAGRDADALARLFPGIAACGYEALPSSTTMRMRRPRPSSR
jgi:uncharacterized protein YbjT (DUF2867 family)